ncbi:MAG TPA: hypothetical protein PK887_10910 [Ignavibacteriales bacterium]|nr:hypothetical protein [Ignavibacteriales bacterium]
MNKITISTGIEYGKQTKKISLNEKNEKFTNNELVIDDFSDYYYSDEDIILDILGDERYNKLKRT